MKIGDRATVSKTITVYDVYGFAGITGDFNSVHINEIEAQKSRFGRPICHGMLIASFISTVLGMYLPGQGTIYLEQNLKFISPAYIGDTITATVEVTQIKNNKIVTLDTKVINQKGNELITGSAKVMIDKGERL